MKNKKGLIQCFVLIAKCVVESEKYIPGKRSHTAMVEVAVVVSTTFLSVLFEGTSAS
jgi:hypothetical protein